MHMYLSPYCRIIVSTVSPATRRPALLFGMLSHTIVYGYLLQLVAAVRRGDKTLCHVLRNRQKGSATRRIRRKGHAGPMRLTTSRNISPSSWTAKDRAAPKPIGSRAAPLPVASCGPEG